MARTFTTSTDVYAAIWANRQEGEETEDDILRRILGCGPKPQAQELRKPQTGTGFHDTRNKVHFPEGFKIFRTYKQYDFSAIASNGMWHRVDTGENYPSLNQLNDSIAEGPENVWNGNWKYRTSDGSVRSINELRP